MTPEQMTALAHDATEALKLASDWHDIEPPIENGYKALAYRGMSGSWIFLIVSWRSDEGTFGYAGTAARADQGVILRLPSETAEAGFRRIVDAQARAWLKEQGR